MNATILAAGHYVLTDIASAHLLGTVSDNGDGTISIGTADDDQRHPLVSLTSDPGPDGRLVDTPQGLVRVRGALVFLAVDDEGFDVCRSHDEDGPHWGTLVLDAPTALRWANDWYQLGADAPVDLSRSCTLAIRLTAGTQTYAFELPSGTGLTYGGETSTWSVIRDGLASEVVAGLPPRLRTLRADATARIVPAALAGRIRTDDMPFVFGFTFSGFFRYAMTNRGWYGGRLADAEMARIVDDASARRAAADYRRDAIARPYRQALADVLDRFGARSFAI